MKRFLSLVSIFFAFSLTSIVYGEDINPNVQTSEVIVHSDSMVFDRPQSVDVILENQNTKLDENSSDITQTSSSFDNSNQIEITDVESSKEENIEDTSDNKDSSVIDRQVSDNLSDIRNNLESDQTQTTLNTSESNTSSLTNSHIFWDNQWDIKNVTNNGKSYEMYQISKNTTVAIIDTGIMTVHPDLSSSIGEYLRNFVPKGGYEGVEEYEYGESADVIDRQGHGTEVAGQITANGNILGVAPGIRINIYRVFGVTYAKSEWIAKAIRQAADDGNRVITISSGQYLMISGSYDDDTNDYQDYLNYKNAVDYASSKGSIIVAALGNEGLNIQDNNEMIDYLRTYRKIKIPGIVVDAPSVFNNVVAVGGIDYYNHLSDFSNYSTNAIYAPAGSTANLLLYGEDVFINQGYYLTDWIFTTSFLGWYQYVYGNSFAAPKVAGALALVADKYDIIEPQQLKNYIMYHSSEINGLKILDIVRLLSESTETIHTDRFYNESRVKNVVISNLEKLTTSNASKYSIKDIHFTLYNSKDNGTYQNNEIGVISLKHQELLPNMGSNLNGIYESLGLFLLLVGCCTIRKIKAK